MTQSLMDPPSRKKSDYYDDASYDYLKYWENREYEHEAEKMAVSRLLTGKHFKNAVDVGGGYGRLSVLLKRYADDVTLVEPSAQQLALARNYLADHPEIHLEQMQADALRFEDESIDLLTLIRVMHHLPDPSDEFLEIARVLTLDGCAIIEAANYAHVRNRFRHMVRRKKLPSGPVDIRSYDNRHNGEVPFVNHNPKTLRRQLAHAGLKVERILSVSNLRNAGIKKIMPKRVMLAIEGVLQPTLAPGYFGPSVFFLVKRVK